ncbi:MAG: 30S ribosomal protein S11 [Candidatus Marinimicrobia bacterium]|nr:30S ribosomal protein S11 [Candidatus Neomarinimicrobiota bacterium]MBT3683082.1 30S ribosomal protein S11 [Candidatus Neomarinimicrobiota bacterium]MBT3759826.1 30S ribosomal protein S11 [Candidatus Neomarinimicrobiota bacterium]MBT3895721.1 30S ribosomal protein S11 [Candidatus Neomarinimicrobiota bacterium]MBT4173240.1 30S ribosomal protein S11 [Candidatus Neomarinimicrobiota bacterium]
MAKPKKSASKKKKIKVDPEGIATIKATFNNTIISLSDKFGNTIAWASAGQVGFKGSRKSTPFAATLAAQKAAEEAMSLGLMNVQVRVKGPGSGREAAVRAIRAAGLNVTSILDVTPIPHNGCRPPKKRRV